ncbi:hypothetical protein CBM2617_B180187 [Cupriavidus taiwanensis]|nr:hypothetical protein CBM2591_B150059 [Cupriavidus taiwanensis]SOZ71850.1 hypothetical protein CBM2617_B180187 [Cupriavidus taiwanensis]SPA48429.1 hypothetical protein CBM2629_B10058 [Cupriavidus taiwanensis]SPD58119.1 protein of unknown function [Cupriavidus taiwanensis]
MMPFQPLPVLPPAMPTRFRRPACPSFFSSLYANNNHSHIRIVGKIANQSLWKAFVFLTFLDGTGGRRPLPRLPGPRQAAC